MAMYLIVLLSLVLSLAVAKPVHSLPGFNGPMPSKLDSGYITVDAVHGRRLFYIFVESQRSPSSDPLVLWLNGGPGCSGMFGMFSEHGPFNMDFNAAGKGLTLNEYTWTKVANMIYIESPAGVGFSSSNVTSDYVTGDQRTADDSYAFLRGFLDKFPQFKLNEFWVTGESYGGHYVPELVFKIQEENRKVALKDQINLVGMMAGNPWTDPQTEAFGVVQNWWDRAIISEKYWEQIQTHCDYMDITFWIINNVTVGVPQGHRFFHNEHKDLDLRKYIQSRGAAKLQSGELCFEALQKTSQGEFAGVDILGVYYDVCNKGTQGNIPDQPNYCAVNQFTTYLNLPEVRVALHVTDPQPKEWTACSAVVSYNFTDTTHSVLYVYKELMNTNIHMLVFSGDNDAIVPYTATRKWVAKLNRTVVNDLHQWWSNTNGEQVGGWATQYDRFTFTTVRAAPHMAAFGQPRRVFDMFQRFLVNHTL